MQLSMFDDQCLPAINWIEVSKKPTIHWLFDNASKAFDAMSTLEEKVFIRTWEAVGIANYMFRRNI